jgi:TPR repeat protein
MQPDYQWAAQVLEPLAERNVPIAQATLGTLHLQGFLGPASDRAKAAGYFERAAKGGDGPSMLGFAETAPGYVCAHYTWLEKAAAARQREAHYYIARCHIEGGVERPDLALAEAELRRFSEEAGNYDSDRIEKLYAELEKRLGRKVARPIPRFRE